MFQVQVYFSSTLNMMLLALLFELSICSVNGAIRNLGIDNGIYIEENQLHSLRKYLSSKGSACLGVFFPFLKEKCMNE